MKEHVKSYTNYLLTNHIELQRIEIVACIDLYSPKARILVIVIKASRKYIFGSSFQYIVFEGLQLQTITKRWILDNVVGSLEYVLIK